jgi:hypothetical protein
MFYTWSVPKSYPEDNWGHQVSSQLIEISAREAVKIEPEPVKLKNLHCQKSLPRNGW